MKKLILASTTLLACTASLAQDLSTVVTIANKVDAPAINDKQIVVIERSDIENSGAASLKDLLVSKADFQFSQNGGVANSTNLYIRGLDSKKILFLINGQRVGSATSGTTDFQLIPVEQIERVEIIKGSRSAIYGADAQAGVINIITRQKQQGTSISATIGTNQTRQIGVRSQIQQGNIGGYVSVLHNASDGYDLDIDSKNDTDGYERNAVNTGINYAINEDQSINLDLQLNKGSYDYDNLYMGTDEADFDNRAYSANYTLSKESISLKAQVGRSYDRSWNYGNGSTRSNGADLFGTRRDSGEITAVIAITEGHSLITGIDSTNTELSTQPTVYDKDSAKNSGALLAYRFEHEDIAFETGARYDDNSAYGDFWSYNTAVELTFDNGDSLALGQSTAFRAPTFNDLYYPASLFGDYSNENLEVETSRVWTLDYFIPLSIMGKSGSFLLSGQRAVFNNQISYDEVYYPYNIGSSYVNYASASWDQDWSSSLRTELIQEWTEAMNLDTGEMLARRPVRATKLNVNWVQNSITARLESMYRDQSATVSGETNASYFIYNLGINYDVNKALTVSARIENLTNRSYETASGYLAQGRYAQLTGRYNF
ncbi:MAG: vitamin B12 transporter [Thalassolituus sp.]|jgi:vitamin B12 transporter|tara:strand:- start:15599 stop:17401 length:1803 start_codon:yes stop_codon:yes gene_type:complete